MKLIDSHCHTNFNIFKDDGTEVIRRALNQDIGLINVGSQYDTSERVVTIANEYDTGVWAAIGIHPIHLSHTEVDEEEIHFKTREEKFDSRQYQALINQDKKHRIVAIGEIGLDYYHLPPERNINEVIEIQKHNLKKQIDFANQNFLPIILHSRGTESDPYGVYDELLSFVKIHQPIKGGVVHCYVGDLDHAFKFIENGFYLGFTGIITFGKNADYLRQVVKELPLERILVETDAPYLSPAPHRGERNEPAFVDFVARKVAEIKGRSYQAVCEQTLNNTKKLFQI